MNVYLGVRYPYSAGQSPRGRIFTTTRKPTADQYPTLDKVVGPFRTKREAILYASKHGIMFMGTLKRSVRPKRNPVEIEGTEIYRDVLAIEARKGKDSLWPKENFRHDFTSKSAKIIGLPDGSLLIKGRKRLWKRFSY